VRRITALRAATR